MWQANGGCRLTDLVSFIKRQTHITAVPAMFSPRAFRLPPKLKRLNSLNKFCSGERSKVSLPTADKHRLYNSEISILHANNTAAPNDNLDSQPQILPEIEFQLPCGEMVCLIDMGSEVTCISDEEWSRLKNAQAKIPTLPVPTIQLRDAVGQKSARIHRQVLLTATTNGEKINLRCLVVKNLIRPCILAADWLRENRADINFQTGCITLVTGARTLRIPFRRRTLNTASHHLTIDGLLLNRPGSSYHNETGLETPLKKKTKGDGAKEHSAR